MKEMLSRRFGFFKKMQLQNEMVNKGQLIEKLYGKYRQFKVDISRNQYWKGFFHFKMQTMYSREMPEVPKIGMKHLSGPKETSEAKPEIHKVERSK